MSPPVQIVAVVAAGTVFIARVVTNLHRARVDSRIAARRAEQEQQR